MKLMMRTLIVVAALSTVAAAQTTQPLQGRDPNTGLAFTIKPSTQPVPREWVDKDTGHRIVRLSDEPNSQSLYFHQYSFSPDGNKLAFTSPTGIYQVDLNTHKIELILAAQTKLDGNTVTNNIIHVGRKTGRIFFTRTLVAAAGQAAASAGAVSQDRGSADRTVWWIDPLTKEEHKIGSLPQNYNVSTVNCDETLLAGAVTYLDGRGGAPTAPVRANAGQRIDLGARWAQHLPMALLTMNAATGELKTFNPSNDWDNHFQFSPTDPNLLMYCHEGPWQNNDRVWTINVDGSNLFKVHTRTMINEIWGHEFWSADGTTSWYQLYTPRAAGDVAGNGSDCWIAGTNLTTHKQTWYHLDSAQASIHVNISRDGSHFAGDGATPNPWIMLHTPHLTRNMAQGVYDTANLIQPGTIDTERLVNMANHQYALEPNVMFTPDMKWIVFRSNMFGPSYVFEVEIAKSKG